MAIYLSLILALSLDTFMAALSYEANKIKIPISSNFIISLICALFLFISLLLGNVLNLFIPEFILKWFSSCAAILSLRVCQSSASAPT